MSVHTEIEAKLKVGSLEAVESRLADCGAVPRSQAMQMDWYFDTDDRELTRTDQCLRLRREDKDGQERLIITYKGPKETDDYKRRAETELTVDDAEAAESLLNALGYHRILAFNKKRQRWKVGACEVALDELPLIGAFVEIEGLSSEDIRRVQDLLSLADAPHQMESYASQIAARLAQLGIKQTEVFL